MNTGWYFCEMSFLKYEYGLDSTQDTHEWVSAVLGRLNIWKPLKKLN